METKETSVTIVADHLALGVVQFTVQATDAKAAFEKWKQVVFSPRQWRVTGNDGPTAKEMDFATKGIVDFDV